MSPPTRRRGSVSVAALIAIPVLVLLAWVVFSVSSLRDAKIENQNGADAAALAAARALACDDMLRPGPESATGRAARARAAARELAGANFAAGERLTLDENADNDPEGDLILGHLGRPLSPDFRPAGTDPAKYSGADVNAVRVVARRSPLGVRPDREVVARATAMLDFRVVGFHPNDDTPLPVIPLGLYTDHDGEAPHAWDTVLRTAARDGWRFDPDAGGWALGADGIPEVRVVLGPKPPGDDWVPGLVLQVGGGDFGQTLTQIRVGVTRTDLGEEFRSGFTLGPGNIMKLTGTASCPAAGSPPGDSLEGALRALRDSGQPRYWQLVSGADDGGDRFHVTGWAAARVAAVERADGGGLVLTLQPAVLHCPAAVTEDRPSPPTFWARNRTVCRVRLAD